MFKVIRKWWKYVTAKLSGSFEERADPKIQLEQAITESQNQHRRLREQAANVIAQQKQTELRLGRKLDELEKANANARQAVLMADDATRKGDTAKAADYQRAAEAIATRLVSLEKEVSDLSSMALQTTQAADQAKAAVNTNAQMLQQKLAEKNQLMGQLEQAKMAEQMNKAMSSLNETVGQDVPTFDEVRQKIEARYAKAQGMSELTETSVESRMLEIEQAAANTEAQARLLEIRAQLGLDGGAAPAEAAAAPTPTPEAAPAPATEPASEPKETPQAQPGT
jgi:phage shock protein A